MEFVIETEATAIGPEAINGLVSCHSADPSRGFSFGSFVEAGFFPEHGKDILGDLFGVWSVVENPIGGGVDGGTKPIMKKIKGVRIPGLAHKKKKVLIGEFILKVALDVHIRISNS